MATNGPQPGNVQSNEQGNDWTSTLNNMLASGGEWAGWAVGGIGAGLSGAWGFAADKAGDLTHWASFGTVADESIENNFGGIVLALAAVGITIGAGVRHHRNRHPAAAAKADEHADPAAAATPHKPFHHRVRDNLSWGLNTAYNKLPSLRRMAATSTVGAPGSTAATVTPTGASTTVEPPKGGLPKGSPKGSPSASPQHSDDEDEEEAQKPETGRKTRSKKK